MICRFNVNPNPPNSVFFESYERLFLLNRRSAKPKPCSQILLDQVNCFRMYGSRTMDGGRLPAHSPVCRSVAKLKTARQRKRELVGKVEGRKSWAEINPELVKEARRFRRRLPKGGQRSLRAVAEELAMLGYVNERGAPFSPSSVQSMLP